jgi:hypothetical protein
MSDKDDNNASLKKQIVELKRQNRELQQQLNEARGNNNADSKLLFLFNLIFKSI